MNELLIQIYTEEIPVLEQQKQQKAVEQFFNNKLELKGKLQIFSSRDLLYIKLIDFSSIFTTPQKIIKGPPVNSNENAINGFLKKVNTQKNLLQQENGFFIFTSPEKIQNLKNLLEEELLIELFTLISRSFSKTMMLNSSKKYWIRPIKQISIVLNNDLISFEYAGVQSQKCINNKKENIILNQAERLAKIKLDVAKIENQNSVKCVSFEKLFYENSYLADFPNIQFDYFDKKYLKLPTKVLIQTLELNQKYFLFNNLDGSLSNLFAVCIDGIYTPEITKNIINGNKKVLHARLEDAIFYLKIDQKQKLISHLEKTKNVIFHKNCGSVFERVDRMVKLSHQFGLHSKDLELTINLCKADLQTEMTKSFPELQGYIGAYYASLEGYPKEICRAIEGHYKLGIEEEVNSNERLSLLLALIEKYEKIDSLLKNGEEPTSSRDPFGIRREALAIVKILIEGNLDIKLKLEGKIKGIILDRLKFYLRTFDVEVVNLIINSIENKTQFSVLQIFNNIKLINSHKQDLDQFYRIINLLKSNDIHNFDGANINQDLFNKEEEALYNAFQNVSTLKSLFQNAYLIDKFFENNLVIDFSHIDLSKNKVALLRFLLQKFNLFFNLN